MQTDVVEAASNALLGVAGMTLDPSLGPSMSPRQARPPAHVHWASQDQFDLWPRTLASSCVHDFKCADYSPALAAISTLSLHFYVSQCRCIPKVQHKHFGACESE